MNKKSKYNLYGVINLLEFDRFWAVFCKILFIVSAVLTCIASIVLSVVFETAIYCLIILSVIPSIVAIIVLSRYVSNIDAAKNGISFLRKELNITDDDVQELKNKIDFLESKIKILEENQAKIE